MVKICKVTEIFYPSQLCEVTQSLFCAFGSLVKCYDLSGNEKWEQGCVEELGRQGFNPELCDLLLATCVAPFEGFPQLLVKKTPIKADFHSQGAT